mmetsp:Transcript_5181/g.13312  ORF Transcript_5181/g.13312 Transcript_5181/m.13312 type:complete len:270 (+) Transcript_5181:585-1394(+)
MLSTFSMAFASNMPAKPSMVLMSILTPSGMGRHGMGGIMLLSLPGASTMNLVRLPIISMTASSSLLFEMLSMGFSTASIALAVDLSPADSRKVSMEEAAPALSPPPVSASLTLPRRSGSSPSALTVVEIASPMPESPSIIWFTNSMSFPSAPKPEPTDEIVSASSPIVSLICPSGRQQAHAAAAPRILDGSSASSRNLPTMPSIASVTGSIEMPSVNSSLSLVSLSPTSSIISITWSLTSSTLATRPSGSVGTPPPQQGMAIFAVECAV